jgi:hypothetical protein
MQLQVKDPHLPETSFAMTPRDLSVVTYLVIHHTDGSPEQSVAQIDQEHRSEGWAMTGYNYVIDGSGTCWSGRPNDVVPAAAWGLNPISLNIAVTGQFQPGIANYAPPRSSQFAALTQLTIDLHHLYPQISHTIGHRDAAAIVNDPSAASACPGQSLYDRLPAIRAAVLSSLGHATHA